VRHEIEFTDEAADELRVLRVRDQRIILDAVEAGLRYEPEVVSRHRKPVVPTELLRRFAITWELRVGAFRVFYDVEPPAAVVVIRIARKGGLTTEGSLR
jgi:mRNA-degrading endonuclease RelE of RelBE toxin-antitoxin system